MWRIAMLYALVLAAGAFALEWLEYRYVARLFPGEAYVVLVAGAFAALGVWSGYRLTRRRAARDFEVNTAAIASLGVTEREYEVLKLLAAGGSNKEIARGLGVSPNTVKTHVARLFEKLEVSRRTQAILKARQLELIP